MALLFAPRSKYLRIRKQDEAKHFLVCGDTGTGKSNYLRQLLHYVEKCGDTAVVLDSKLEFIPEFFNARRGDKILSPKDKRCPYWDLGGEVTDEVDAKAVTRAMYPSSQPGSGNEKWFDDQACSIGAYLLTYSDPRPSCAEFGYWLSNPDEIHRRVKGSEHEQTLNKSAANQLTAILSTMNKVGQAMRMMPPPADLSFRESFTIREWADNPDGWLFLPNTAVTRDALQPVQSGWADMALLRIMSRAVQKRRVWFFFDELDSLGKLSKLSEAMGMMRSTGNPMVLGMQNPAQLEDRYGRSGDTIFSQAFTKVICAVSEDKSAKRLEQLIGEEERRYFRESQSDDNKITISGPQDVRKPVILASEIQGLPDLTAYFLQRPTDKETGLHVVPFRMEYDKPVHHTKPMVERVISLNSYVPDEVTEAEVQSQKQASNGSPAATYTAPKFLVIANNSTVHNEQLSAEPAQSELPFPLKKKKASA